MKIDLALIAQVLAKAEAFLAGQAVEIPVQPLVETIDGVTVEIAFVAGGVSIVKK